MLTTKRALVPRRQGTGRQTTFRSFAVNPSDFDCLEELDAGSSQQENAGAFRTQIAPLPPKSTQPTAAKLSELPTAQHAADQLRSPLRILTQVLAAPVAGDPAFAIAGVVTATMREAEHQLVAPRRLLCDMQRTWRNRGSGRITKRYNFSTSIKPLEQAECQYRAKLAAEAAAEEARIRAAAEAAARAEAEAKAQAEAARQAEEEACAAAEAAEAARMAAKAEAAAQAEVAAKAAADEEARAAAEAEELVLVAAEAEAARMESEAQAAEAATLAAAVAAAAAAAATPVAAKAARAVAKTPGSSFAAGWSPIEGIPEMHTRPRTRCAAKAAADAATPGQLCEFTPVEGVPETARGFNRSRSKDSDSSQQRKVLCKTAFTPIEGVPEKDASFQRTPFDKQLQRAGAAGDIIAQEEASLASLAGDAVEDGGEVTADEMAAALQQVDSMVAGIVSASPNTPASRPLPVYLTSMPRTRAAEVAAASFYRHTADKPGHMNVAIQYSAGRSPRCGAQQGPKEDTPAAACQAGASGVDAAAAEHAAAAEAANADGEDTPGDVAAALWDDDGDEYAGAGGDYSEDAADLDAAAAAAADADTPSAAALDHVHDHAAEGAVSLAVAPSAEMSQQQDQSPSLAAEAAGGGSAESIAVNSHSADALSPSPRLTPEFVQPAAAGTAAAASKRRLQSAVTPREGRQAKSRKSLAGDGLTTGADGRRVSKRTRHKPLEFWRSERVEYVRDHRTLPTVKRYVSKTPDPIWPAPSNQQVRRARSKLSQKQKEQQEQQQSEQQHRDEAEEEEAEEHTHAAASSSAAAAAATSGVGAKRGRGRPPGKSTKKAKR